MRSAVTNRTLRGSPRQRAAKSTRQSCSYLVSPDLGSAVRRRLPGGWSRERPGRFKATRLSPPRRTAAVPPRWPTGSGAPIRQAAHRHEQRVPERSKLVVDARRNGRKHRARDETVTLEPPERQGQHALRDAAERVVELVESLMIADRHLSTGTGSRRPAPDVVLTAILGHVQVTRYHGCAFMRASPGDGLCLGIRPNQRTGKAQDRRDVGCVPDLDASSGAPRSSIASTIFRVI